MRILTIIIFLTATLLLTVSCAGYRQSALEAGAYGFTAEIDEPSSRGSLQRVSPEQSDVWRRFCISPSGKHIVYSGKQAGSGSSLFQLWKIPAAGGAPVKLTSGGISNFRTPSFTSDGKYILYESEGNLWRVKSDGAGGKMKIPGSGAGFDFGPNVSIDNKVVFCSVYDMPSTMQP